MLPTISFTALTALGGARVRCKIGEKGFCWGEKKKEKDQRVSSHGGGGVIVGDSWPSSAKAQWVFAGVRQKYSDTCAASSIPTQLQ